MSLATVPHTQALARFAHAVGEPTRAGILLALRSGPAQPSELAEALGVSRQVLSNQLACLRGCGLVEREQEGRRSWYRLADDRLSQLLGELLSVVLAVEPDCCGGGECAC